MGREFSVGKVRVYWDLKDFPVPEGRRIRDIVGDFLTRMGYSGPVSITAYGESAEDNQNLDSGITFVHRSDKYWRLNKMIVDIAFGIVPIRDPDNEPTTLMVVAKGMEEETQFVNLLENWNWSGFNVYLVLPDVYDDPEKVPLPYVNLVWSWTSLLQGGEPMGKEEFFDLLDRGKRKNYLHFSFSDDDDV